MTGIPSSTPGGSRAVVLGPPSVPFLWVGGASIVVGGLLAAVTSPLSLEHGSWASAYLVLVTGVALVLAGCAQSVLAPSVGSRIVTGELLGWLLGSLAVIGGTLLGSPPIVDIGGALIVLAAVLFFIAGRGDTARSRPLILWAYRIVLLIIVVSVPIGLVLSALRHG